MAARRTGFTLIELLVVVAIIAILAAIAIPNYLEARVRAKVTRVRADFRNLATALETYHLDNSGYPIGWPGVFCPLFALSTPIAYVGSGMFVDPFFSKECIRFPGEHEWYFLSLRSIEDDAGTINIEGRGHGLADWWLLVSYGPDRDVLPAYSSALEVAADAVSGEAFMLTVYDSTNGTVSSGNVYRTGGGGMNWGGRQVFGGS